jgi:uncharacterized coiled-coil protein SlyX
MAKFDPARHRVVAVPFQDDDPEKGQHFHVDLDALVDAAREAAVAAGDVSRETLGDDQGIFLTKRINALEARVAELEARPVVSEDMLRQFNDAFNARVDAIVEQKVNKAMGDVRSRLVTVEKKSTSLTTTAQDPDSTKITRLATLMQSFGEVVRDVENSFEQRCAELDQKYAEISEHITETNLKIMQLMTKLYRALAALEHDDEGKDAA